MNTYRVVFSDTVKSQTFNFAVTYKARSRSLAFYQASNEFPDCAVVSIEELEFD